MVAHMRDTGVGWGFSGDDSDFASDMAKAFWAEHADMLQGLVNRIESYSAARDGDALLLLDASLLALAQRIRDHLQRLGLTVEKAPPSLGELLSKKAQ